MSKISFSCIGCFPDIESEPQTILFFHKNVFWIMERIQRTPAPWFIRLDPAFFKIKDRGDLDDEGIYFKESNIESCSMTIDIE